MKRIFLSLVAFATTSFIYAAEPVPAPAKSPAEQAIADSLAALYTNPRDGAKILEAGFNLFFNFPPESVSSAVLPSMYVVMSSYMSEAEGAPTLKIFKERLAAAIAQPDLTDDRREKIMFAYGFMEMSAQTRATPPDYAAAHAKIDELVARFPASLFQVSLELSYAKLLAKGHPGADEVYLNALLAKPDINDVLREGLLANHVRTEITKQTRAAKPDLAAVRAEIDALVARYPQVRNLAGIELAYAKLVSKVDPAAGTALMQPLSTSTDAAVAEQATAALALAKSLDAPIEMKFIAADGREVDLAKLRGKVVLIDFWATWCVPCIAELPNIKKVYADYHDKGFEVVGIALENGKLMPNDTPERIETKLATARKILNDFTAKNEMPWPQHFDGKYWKNDIATQYSISSVPAMFILNQEGKVVTTSARGEALEPLVKKLLGLAP